MAVSHMGQEITQQPAALAATIEALLPLRDDAAAVARGTRAVLLIARGTSDNAAVYGSYLLQAYAGRLATLAAPSIATTYRSRLDLSGVLAVALSQSGQTREIVDTLAWARDCGAATLAITNGAGSPLTQTADLSFITQAGTEQAVPATKTYTTQLADTLFRYLDTAGRFSDAVTIHRLALQVHDFRDHLGIGFRQRFRLGRRDVLPCYEHGFIKRHVNSLRLLVARRCVPMDQPPGPNQRLAYAGKE